MSKPLQGTRVIDLSRLLPGPLASLILHDLGADVTSVDSAHNPDFMPLAPPLCDDGVSVFHHALQRGKTRVSLDLRTDEGKDHFRSLLKNADVLIESYRPHVLSSFGFSDVVLTADFPKLIVCHLSGYGQQGPHARTPGHDLNFLAESGLMGLFNVPTVIPFQVADIGGGTLPAVIRIMAALMERGHTGRGSVIDHSITAYCAFLAVGQWATDNASYVLGGTDPQYSIYKCSDGYIAVGSLEAKFHTVLFETLGFKSHPKREEVQAKFAEKTTSEWVEALSPLNICVSPIRDFNDERAKSTRPKGVFVDGVTRNGVPVELPRFI